MLNKKNRFIILIITLTTIVGSIYFYTRRKHQQHQDPEKIISEVRTYFMNVIGSYILHEPIAYKNTSDTTLVFQGGITTQHNGSLASYDFFVDANSGEIINIIECE
ncbi:hypothetical protein [Staphylococcus shinii]|uniref:hypothetical protein n=1 Tax=Staphylococcus shinii TaxID=2912228 RepID=UPI003F5508C2